MKLLNIPVYIVYKLFAAVFDKGMVPSTWLRAIVNPIPKSAGKYTDCIALFIILTRVYIHITVHRNKNINSQPHKAY